MSSFLEKFFKSSNPAQVGSREYRIQEHMRLWLILLNIPHLIYYFIVLMAGIISLLLALLKMTDLFWSLIFEFLILTLVLSVSYAAGHSANTKNYILSYIFIIAAYFILKDSYLSAFTIFFGG